MPADDLTRRECLTTFGAVTGAFGVPLIEDAASAAPAGAVPIVPLGLTVNGRPHQLSIDPRTTLLDLLREHLGLTGTKKGCDHGQCGLHRAGRWPAHQ